MACLPCSSRKLHERLPDPGRAVVCCCCWVVLVPFMLWWNKPETIMFVFSHADSRVRDTHLAPLAYRLGDMVSLPNARWGFGGEKFHMYWFPGSIAVEYMQRTVMMEQLHVLSEIIDEKAEIWSESDGGNKFCPMVQCSKGEERGRERERERERENDTENETNRISGNGGVKLRTLAVHLRLGDVLEHREFAEILMVKPGRVETHFGTGCWLNQSREIAAMALSRKADEDVVFMLTKAFHIVVSRGRYARILHRVADYRGIPVDGPICGTCAYETSEMHAQVRKDTLQLFQALKHWLRQFTLPAALHEHRRR
eukprot:TRINITY_DN8121_c1_g1_i1.p1 TRINITY_DN8121_c1_g1~~TRINITY_DN8121_c1_g1_i1.p1  ORF type:complete len:312 (-),score=36.56 TRINITY_DN8121_c1_g1_i1:5-940(-)